MFQKRPQSALLLPRWNPRDGFAIGEEQDIYRWFQAWQSPIAYHITIARRSLLILPGSEHLGQIRVAPHTYRIPEGSENYFVTFEQFADEGEEPGDGTEEETATGSSTALSPPEANQHGPV